MVFPFEFKVQCFAEDADDGVEPTGISVDHRFPYFGGRDGRQIAFKGGDDSLYDVLLLIDLRRRRTYSQQSSDYRSGPNPNTFLHSALAHESNTRNYYRACEIQGK